MAFGLVFLVSLDVGDGNVIIRDRNTPMHKENEPAVASPFLPFPGMKP
jgi:hypothetical protein